MPESKSGALPLGDSPINFYDLDLIQSKSRKRMLRQTLCHDSPHLLRHSSSTACASASLANSANTQAPEPRHHRRRKLPSQQILRHFRIHFAHHRLQIVTQPTVQWKGSAQFGRARIVMEFVSRVNSGCVKISAVGTCTGGNNTTYHASGTQKPAIARPLPRQRHFRQTQIPAHPHPASAPSASDAFARQPQLPQLFKASRVVAASELPPPRPPPIGIRFSSVISTPSVQPLSCCSRRAARTHKSCSCRHTLQRIHAPHLTILAQGEMQRVAEIDKAEQGLQQMITVRPAPYHMQKQIELGRCRARSAY